MTVIPATFGPAQDVRIYAGSDFAIQIVIEGADGPVDLSGRAFAMVAFDAATETEVLSRSAVASGASVDLAFTGDETRAIREQKGSRIYRFQTMELTDTGIDVITDGILTIVAAPSTIIPVQTGDPGSAIIQVVRTGDRRQVVFSYQGAPGFSAAQQLMQIGAIAEATPAALKAYLDGLAEDSGSDAGAAAGATAGAAAGATAGAASGATAGQAAGAAAVAPSIAAANDAAAAATAKIAETETARQASISQTGLAAAATGAANTAAGAANTAAADAVAKTALTVTATTAANAATASANNAAAQIVPEGGPSLLIKPGTGTFPSVADTYFTGRKSLYSNFDGIRRQLRGFADVTDFARASTATYFDAIGALQTAASGVARLGYRSSGAAGVLAGLLVEAQDTEYVTNSILAGAVVGVIGSGGALPTGMNGTTSTGREIVATGTIKGIPYVDMRIFGTPTANNDQYSIEPGQTSTVGTVWTVGLMVSLIAGSLTNINSFLLQSGNEGGGTAFTPDATLTARANTRTLTQSLARTVLRWTYGNTTTPVDFTLRLALPQRRLASFMTSPILTAGAQATRAGDVLGKALGVEFNPASQTALFRTRWEREPADGVTKMLWQWDDGTPNNRVSVTVSGAGVIQAQVVVGGVAGATIAGPTAVAGTDYKIAVGFAGSLRLVVNGTVYTDATIATLPAVTTRRIGSSTTGVVQPNAFIMPYLPHPTNPLLDATEFPRLLTVAEMQGYTA